MTSLIVPGPRGHHHHLVAEQDRLLDRVRHEDHRLAHLVENARELLLHDDFGLRIERGERLVHQQDRPLHDQRARQRHALAHAAGELVGRFYIRSSFSPTDGEHLLRACIALPRGTPAISSPKATLSITLRQGNRLRLCHTMTERRQVAGGAGLSGGSAMRTARRWRARARR